MAHWAEIDKDNIVLRVVVGNNNDPDEGYSWLVNNLGGTWVKTSYNTVAGTHTKGGTPFRKNFAGIGFTYSPSRDAFIGKKPYSSWVLNEETCCWDSPTPYPTDGLKYIWNESIKDWELFSIK